MSDIIDEKKTASSSSENKVASVERQEMVTLEKDGVEHIIYEDQFDFTNIVVKEKLQHFTCSICHHLFKLPVLLNNDDTNPCHHLFCQDCITIHLVSSDQDNCPTCRKKTLLRHIIPAIQIRRELADLKITCMNSDGEVGRCEWKQVMGMNYENYLNHATTCSKALMIYCEFKSFGLKSCQEKMTRENYRLHCVDKSQEHLGAMDTTHKELKVKLVSTKRTLGEAEELLKEERKNHKDTKKLKLSLEAKVKSMTEEKVKDNRKLCRKLQQDREKYLDPTKHFRWKFSDWKEEWKNCEPDERCKDKRKHITSESFVADGEMWHLDIKICKENSIGLKSYEITIDQKGRFDSDLNFSATFIGKFGMTISCREVDRNTLEVDVDDVGEIINDDGSLEIFIFVSKVLTGS